MITPEFLDKAADALPGFWFEFGPEIGLVLGSGWGGAVMERDFIDRLPYTAVPGLGASTVAGHAGEARLLEIGGRRVVAFCGRRHFYEGEGWGPVVLPVELMRRMGVRTLLLTNAAGGMNPEFSPGDLMLVTDHVNTTGMNPLQGPLIPGWGTRFPDQSEVYSREFAATIRSAAAELGIALHEGIYAYTAGPCYETPAEVRAYHIWKADAVGMSTVPEAIVANAIGMRVGAVSCITNMASGITGRPLSHSEVMEATESGAGKMRRLVEAVAASAPTL
jgi:purine-nucleoside phosphorylase